MLLVLSIISNKKVSGLFEEQLFVVLWKESKYRGDPKDDIKDNLRDDMSYPNTGMTSRMTGTLARPGDLFNFVHLRMPLTSIDILWRSHRSTYGRQASGMHPTEMFSNKFIKEIQKLQRPRNLV